MRWVYRNAVKGVKELMNGRDLSDKYGDIQDIINKSNRKDALKIIKAEKHPEADRLQVCEVDAGAHGRLQIVCGAPNARVGLKAPLAMVGWLNTGRSSWHEVT